ncbi:MAG: S1-like domain-containing RNA-binding protein [Bacteroidales bacterium]
MVEIGRINNLRVVKEVDFGVYLDGGDMGEILLPQKYVVPEDYEKTGFLDVFIYLDSEDRLIATTEKPFAKVGEFAFLKVAAVNKYGAFLDWGLPKDLLVPFREQKQNMEEGKSYVVYIYVDNESQRIAASAKVDKFLDLTPIEYVDGEEVDLMIYSETDIGFKAIINRAHWGILYKNEVFQKLKTGDAVKGYIKKIRDDNKIDLSLQKTGFELMDEVAENILAKLKEKNGFIPVGDKSSPETISAYFGISKKSFKKSVGLLYKKRLITLENEGIRLIENSQES